MVYDQLLDIFKRVMPQVDVNKIKEDSALVADLGVDSLNMMLLAISVEDEFHIHFDSTAEIKTVKDICDYVEKEINK